MWFTQVLLTGGLADFQRLHYELLIFGHFLLMCKLLIAYEN